MGTANRQPVALTGAEFGPVEGSDDQAKTIMLYVNGDKYFHGKPMVVSRRHTQTWDTFLRQATEKVRYSGASKGTPDYAKCVTEISEGRGQK